MKTIPEFKIGDKVSTTSYPFIDFIIKSVKRTDGEFWYSDLRIFKIKEIDLEVFEEKKPKGYY